jgi:hemolysin activation/secretion protein
LQGLDRQFFLSAGLETETTRTRLGGEPFSFAPWAENGRARVALLFFGQDWIQRDPSQVLALRSTFKLGIDAFDATRNDRTADSRFFSWLGQAQWARRFDTAGQLILRGDLQLSADPLMTMEQYALGGLDSVRGYRTNQLVRDNALFVSAEFRYAVDALLDDTRGGAASGLSLALFADYGHGWNRNGPAVELHSIYSVGLGLLWDPTPEIHAELYWGLPLREVESTGDSLQDDGIHFRTVWRPQS